MAEAVFDGELLLTQRKYEVVEVPEGHDVVLQVAYRIVDRPTDEHWHLRFRAGLGDEGDATGPAMLDVIDRHHRVDNESGHLEQRVSVPPGRHRLGFTVEAFYSTEPWDKHMVDESKQESRIDGDVTVQA